MRACVDLGCSGQKAGICAPSSVISRRWSKDESGCCKTKSGPCSRAFIRSAMISRDQHSCRSWYTLVIRARSSWFLRIEKNRRSSLPTVPVMSFPAFGNGCPFFTFSLQNHGSCDRFLTHSVILRIPYSGFSAFYGHTPTRKSFLWAENFSFQLAFN